MNIQANPIIIDDSSPKTPLLYKILIILVMMTIIGGLLTGVMTYMNVGFSDTFFVQWRNALLSAYAVMPIGMGLMLALTKLVNYLIPGYSDHVRNLTVGGMMAIIMESLLSFSTATNTIGFTDYNALFSGWLNGFLGALPVGLGIMVVMSMTIKPRIEQFMKS